jgi:predicted Zn finger-like uncharacterized protein
MKFVCDRCQTRYSIADEKVRMKILRIRCKTCGNVILVQGEGATGEPVDATHGSATAKPASGLKAVSGSRSAQPGSTRPASAGTPKSAPPPIKPAAGPPPPPPPVAADAEPVGGRVEWYIAVGGVQSGPFSRAEAAKRIVAIGQGKTVHVWKEGMSGWKPSAEVSVIARELTLLRPPAPPPPPPAIPAKSLKATGDVAKAGRTPAPVATPSVAGAHATKAATDPAEEATTDTAAGSLFPGKPLTPTPQPVAEAPTDFPTDPELEAFTEITTKKAKKIPDLGSGQPRGSFADVTTKKGKNLRELESDPLFEAAATFAEQVKTPPPVDPVPSAKGKTPVPARAAASLGARPSAPGIGLHAPAIAKSGTPPPVSALGVAGGAHTTPAPAHVPTAGARTTPAPVSAQASAGAGHAPTKTTTPPPVRASASLSISSTNLPVAVNRSLHQSAIDALPPVTFDPPETPAAAKLAGVDGFAEVMAAVAAVQQTTAGPEAAFGMAPLAEPTSAPLAPAPHPGHGLDVAGPFKRNPGLKFVVAVAIIVVLVILLVVVSLRGDGGKSSASAASASSPPKPEPVIVEEPKPAVPEIVHPQQPVPTPQERSVAVVRPGGKHAGRTVRSVGPSPAADKQPSGKASVKPAPSEGKRPNPFDEVHSVSQQQISAVVRNKANQFALKACYERALKMDNHLTSGRIDVTVSISAGGAVQRVVVNAPSSFIMVEPCIKAAVKRWVFPSNVEDYATNFPLIMQGGM